MSNVTVSVVLCTYNGAAFVARQIDTVLAQTRPADEIIIQDDGSTDATMDILNDYARRFPVIRVFRNATPLGVNAKDRKSTRLNSSHANISYAVFCLKKKKMISYDHT